MTRPPVECVEHARSAWALITGAPHESGDPRYFIDDRVGGRAKPADGKRNGEIAHVRLRYKLPGVDESQLLEYPIAMSSLVADGKTSPDLRFAASVAAFGQQLRGGKYLTISVTTRSRRSRRAR